MDLSSKFITISTRSKKRCPNLNLLYNLDFKSTPIIKEDNKINNNSLLYNIPIFKINIKINLRRRNLGLKRL